MRAGIQDEHGALSRTGRLEMSALESRLGGDCPASDFSDKLNFMKMHVEPQDLSEPAGLREAVAKHFGRDPDVVRVLNIERIEHYSQIGPLWSGTVYTYRLSRKRWPYKAYVFQMRDATGALRWSLYRDDELHI